MVDNGYVTFYLTKSELTLYLSETHCLGNLGKARDHLVSLLEGPECIT